MYEHLSRMSFSFYDRVQSGQLISRGNSDIRQVQMYLAMAPIVFVQCSVAVLAFALMLTINVPLAFVAMSTMPFVFVVGRPHAALHVPGVVADPVAPRRRRHRRRREHQRRARREVVRGRGGPAQQAHRARRSAPSGRTSRTPTSGPSWAPLIENLPRLGQALVLLYGGYLAINGQATVGDIVAFNAYVLMLQPPFRQLGMILMMGQRAAASAQRIYEVLDEQPDGRRPPGRGRPRRVPRRRPLRRRVVRLRQRHRRAPRTSTCTCDPGETVALVGRTGTGKSHGGAPARALLRRHRRRGARRRPRRPRPHAAEPAPPHRHGARRAVPLLGVDPRQHRLRSARRVARRRGRRGHRPPAPTTSSARCRRATTPSSASAASRCRAASASASRSPARSW